MWAGVTKGGKGGKGIGVENAKGKGKGKGKGSPQGAGQQESPGGQGNVQPSPVQQGGDNKNGRQGAPEGAGDTAERRPAPAPKKKMGLRWLTRVQFAELLTGTAQEGMSAEQAWKMSLEALQAVGIGNQSNKPYQVARMKLSAQLKEKLEQLGIPEVIETGKPEKKLGHDGKNWTKKEYIDYWALAPHGQGPLELREVLRRWQEAEAPQDAKLNEPAEYIAVAFTLETADVTFINNIKRRVRDMAGKAGGGGVALTCKSRPFG
eukprot:gene1428-4301_t